MTNAKHPKDAVWARDEVDSPCVKLCVIHPEERLCVGCYRSIEEISVWSRMTPEARAAVMADLPGPNYILQQKKR